MHAVCIRMELVAIHIFSALFFTKCKSYQLNNASGILPLKVRYLEMSLKADESMIPKCTHDAVSTMWNE